MKTIMIVDYETDIRKEVRLFLENNDFEVFTAKNNREALEHIDKTKEDDINLILVDTVTPFDKKPAFFSMKPTSKINFDINNIENFLQKPFTEDQLLNFIKNRIDF